MPVTAASDSRLTKNKVSLCGPFEMPSGKQLMARALKMSSSSSIGPDGRAPSELWRIRLWIWGQVAKVFSLIFLKRGQWSSVSVKSNEGPLPFFLLRTAFFALVYSSSSRWHDIWCPEVIFGGRPCADALRTALEIGEVSSLSVWIYRSFWALSSGN